MIRNDFVMRSVLQLIFRYELCLEEASSFLLIKVVYTLVIYNHDTYSYCILYIIFWNLYILKTIFPDGIIFHIVSNSRICLPFRNILNHLRFLMRFLCTFLIVFVVFVIFVDFFLFAMHLNILRAGRESL